MSSEKKTKLNIFYFNNASGLGTAKAGGTARHIETARNLIKDGHIIYIVTTPGAYELYKRENLRPKKFIVVKAHIFRTQEKSRFDRIISYIVSTLHSIILIPKLPKCSIVYAPSDYFCDVIPSIAYKFYNKGSSLIVMIHHICKSPFRRKGSFLFNMLSYVFQRLSFVFIASFANKVLVYDTPEGKIISSILKKLGFNGTTFQVFNGIDYKKISNSIDRNVEKKYYGCFAGGLRATKGIYELIPIWQHVCYIFPESKLIIAGEGSKDVVEDFKSKIKDAGLTKNFILTGALDSKTLYQTMSRSKVFLSTSHEEGWGIAICEALACETPVVAFDLPAFEFLENTIIKIQRFDHEVFANKIIELVRNSKQIEKLGRRGREFVKKFDWEEISKVEYEILKR